MLAFAYILIAVIVALTVPLAVNLRARTESDLIGEAKVTSQALAATVGAEALAPDDRKQLQRQAETYAEQIGGRVLIMDADGTVLADADPSTGPASSAVGEDYLRGQRPEITTALVDGQPDAQIRYSEELGKPIMVAAAPIIDDTVNGGPTTVAGAVRITFDVQGVTDAVRNVTIGIVVIGIGGLLAGMLIALGLAGSLARPLTALSNTAKRLGGGDLSARAGSIKGPKEVEDLATSFDEMADRVERTFEAQRSFVANASHQLRTPLTGMKLRIERAIDESRDPDQRHHLEAADHEVDRMAATIDRMLQMAHEIEEGEPTQVDLHEVIAKAVGRWSERAAARGSSITRDDAGGEALVQANPVDVDQIVDNLIDNAVAYAPGPIELRSSADDGRVLLSVRDHGPGIPTQEQQRVTERFYRGQGSPPGGSGLGLAIARDLAEKWGGDLAIVNPDDGGTRVDVRFRRVPSPTTPGATPAATEGA